MEDKENLIGDLDGQGEVERAAAERTAADAASDETVVTSDAAAREETVIMNGVAANEAEVDGSAPSEVEASSESPEKDSKDSPVAARHMREALFSLPSLEQESDDEGTKVISDDQTVVVTHTPVVEQQPVFPDTQDSDDAEAASQALSSLVSVPEDSVPLSTESNNEGVAETAVAAPLSPEPITEGVQSLESPVTSQLGEKRDGKKILKRVLIGLVSTAGALGVIYAGAGMYFTSHFLPNTTVNGEDVSGMSVEDLASYVNSIGENYKTTIQGDGLDLTIAGHDINFVYDGATYSSQAASQIDPWRWPMQISDSHAYVVNQAITFDEEKLQELVGAAVDKANEGASQPTNATMRYDEATSAFVVAPDALGTAIDRNAVIGVVSEGVATMQTKIEIGNDQLVQPTIKADDEKLAATIKTANGILDAPTKLRIAGQDALTLDRNMLAGWLSADGESNLQVNQDAIKQWAQGPLSEQFDSVGTKRSFTRPDGKHIEVEGGSPDYNYGWCLDGEALANTLAENLRNANTDSIDVPMKKTAATWNPGGQDWPNRYIDVDLSEQHVRMYDDSSNLIWETDCVSGDPSYGGGTDTGVFFIYMKASPMELVGLDYNHDGEPDYRTWVTYWMPFDGGEGLHDISRYAFGGSIYTYNGSHGCVNLSYSAAESLWNLTNVGDCVVVHW